MNIHFIAIGGAAMHNLAITLKQKGYRVTGSDDEIVEPLEKSTGKTRLITRNIWMGCQSNHHRAGRRYSGNARTRRQSGTGKSKGTRH